MYFHFGNKATVLKEIIDVLSVGDDEPIPVLDRPWVEQVRDKPDGHRTLADKQALRPDLSTEEAADIIFTLVSFEVYLLLTGVRGWTPEQWERWIHTIIAAAIQR
ncbi:hypothetical protein [Nonomuraea sp. 10N515B]|uniref:hypothetical protein n=1 Tax=Nonomuraea sp. 10N515B TaxID=3457422 RepID=UPI003FCCF588